jgi:hypothetical protein
VQGFLERLVARRLAVRLTYRPDRGHVYHVHHWSLYRALGDEEGADFGMVVEIGGGPVDPAAVTIGLPVEAYVEHFDNVSLPQFRPRRTA